VTVTSRSPNTELLEDEEDLLEEEDWELSDDLEDDDIELGDDRELLLELLEDSLFETLLDELEFLVLVEEEDEDFDDLEDKDDLLLRLLKLDLKELLELLKLLLLLRLLRLLKLDFEELLMVPASVKVIVPLAPTDAKVPGMA
jgi:hypothetical protein